jgi:hypothetical protein
VSVISNILRRRLEAQPVPQAHLEPDLLAAWLEHSLLPEERDQVVRHMAVCAQCREVAFLSLPAEPEAALLRTIPARKSFWLFGLRWAALAAVMVVITVLALRQPWSNERNLRGKTQSIPAVPAALPVANAGIASESASVASSEAKTGLQAEQNSARVTGAAGQTAFANKKQETVALDSRPGFLNDQRFKPQDKDEEDFDRPASMSANTPASLAAQPSAQFPSLTGSNQSSGSASLLNGLAVGGPGPAQPAPMPAPKSSFKALSRPFNRAKRLPRITTGSFIAMGGDGMFSLPQTSSFSEAAPGRPSAIAEKPGVVSSGAFGLKDSAAFTMGARSSTSLNYSTIQATDWKIESGRLLKSTATSGWVDGYPHRDDFSAVTAHGNDVWAGGAYAVLFHSRDGGVEWESVKLGEGASGAVDQITVQGASVIVRTSTQQTWSSPDSGKSWTRVPSN